MPRRHTHLARRAGAAVLAGGLLLGATPALAATAVPTAPATARTASDPGLTAWDLTFDQLSPGETRWDTVDIASTYATAGTGTMLSVTAMGDLADSISTTLVGCSVPWQGDTCGGASATLARDWRAPASGPIHGLMIPAHGKTYLRVGVTVDADAEQGASGSLTYRLTFQGDEPGGQGDEPGGQGDEPGGQGDEPGGKVDGGPDQPGGGTDATTDDSTTASSVTDHLPRTGIALWSTLVAAGALLGAGIALLLGALSRRRRAAAAPTLDHHPTTGDTR